MKNFVDEHSRDFLERHRQRSHLCCLCSSNRVHWFRSCSTFLSFHPVLLSHNHGHLITQDVIQESCFFTNSSRVTTYHKCNASDIFGNTTHFKFVLFVFCDFPTGPSPSVYILKNSPSISIFLSHSNLEEATLFTFRSPSHQTSCNFMYLLMRPILLTNSSRLHPLI
jgi:hypothetical protein